MTGAGGANELPDLRRAAGDGESAADGGATRRSSAATMLVLLLVATGALANVTARAATPTASVRAAASSFAGETSCVIERHGAAFEAGVRPVLASFGAFRPLRARPPFQTVCMGGLPPPRAP